MRPRIIGKILELLTKEYNAGACDDLSEEGQLELYDKLDSLYSLVSDKLDKTYTTELASRYLNVTRLSINNYVKLGKLHPKKQLGGVLLFSKKELDKLIRK